MAPAGSAISGTAASVRQNITASASSSSSCNLTTGWAHRTFSNTAPWSTLAADQVRLRVAFVERLTKLGPAARRSTGGTKPGLPVYSHSACRNDNCCWIYATLNGFVLIARRLTRWRRSASVLRSAVQ